MWSCAHYVRARAHVCLCYCVFLLAEMGVHLKMVQSDIQEAEKRCNLEVRREAEETKDQFEKVRQSGKYWSSAMFCYCSMPLFFQSQMQTECWTALIAVVRNHRRKCVSEHDATRETEDKRDISSETSDRHSNEGLQRRFQILCVCVDSSVQ